MKRVSTATTPGTFFRWGHQVHVFEAENPDEGFLFGLVDNSRSEGFLRRPMALFKTGRSGEKVTLTVDILGWFQ